MPSDTRFVCDLCEGFCKLHLVEYRDQWISTRKNKAPIDWTSLGKHYSKHHPEKNLTKHSKHYPLSLQYTKIVRDGQTTYKPTIKNRQREFDGSEPVCTVVDLNK